MAAMKKKNSNSGGGPTPESIREMIIAFQRSRVVLTAFELGIFTALGDDALSAADVSGKTGTDAKAAERLMNALCALDLLEKRNGSFRNTPAASRCLVEGRPDYMAGIMHLSNLWETWSTLTGTVRSGKPVIGDEINDRGDGWLVSFIAAMHDRARRTAPAVVSLLDLSGVRRVLDVGGGSGVYSMAFVKAADGITAAVFDLPGVAPITKGYIDREGLAGRIGIFTGDYNTDPLPPGFDLVFLSAVVHSNSHDENRELIRKCAASLNPGGRVVVQDFIMNDDRTAPAHGALFSINMLVGTRAGDVYTETEIRGWMEDAGMARCVRVDTDFGTSLVIGRKN